jgi:hypothetical protein
MYHQPLDLIRAAKDSTELPLNIYGGPAVKPKSIFAGFLKALHESRSLQAGRVLRRYEHLVVRPSERNPRELKQGSGGQEMLVSGRPAHARLARRPAPGEMGWLLAVALAFIVLHIIAGTIWQRASTNVATTPAEAFHDPIEAGRQPAASSQQRLPFVQETNRGGRLLELSPEELSPVRQGAPASLAQQSRP